MTGDAEANRVGERIVESGGRPVAVVEPFTVRGLPANPETCLLFVLTEHPVTTPRFGTWLPMVERTGFPSGRGLYLLLAHEELSDALDELRAALGWECEVPDRVRAALALASDHATP
jgi:hypothetical protein